MKLNLTVQLDRETDGRWIAEVLDRPGVLAYGATTEGATAAALRVLAEQLSPMGRPVGSRR